MIKYAHDPSPAPDIKMNYRRLGRTGFEVSEISLGTVEIGLDYGLAAEGQPRRPSESDAARLLHRALDLGVNYLDTARAYGESEAIIGRALAARRKEFILCSKVQTPADPATLREQVRDSVHTSLKLLATDSIEILMIHCAASTSAISDQMTATLEELRAEGKIQFLGASVYGEQAALAFIRSGRYDCLQIAMSALDRRPEERLLPEAVRARVGIVVRSVLLKGVLTPRHQYLPESLAPLREAGRRLNQLARAAAMTLPELAYRWVLRHPAPLTALAGASSVEELEAAVRFAEAGPLSAELCQQIRDITVKEEQMLNPATWGPGQ